LGRHLERGALAGSAIAEVPDRATIIRGQAELAGSAANLVKRAGRRAAVFVGGPDDWAAATGRHLAAGT
jgi:hypothetical protein